MHRRVMRRAHRGEVRRIVATPARPQHDVVDIDIVRRPAAGHRTAMVVARQDHPPDGRRDRLRRPRRLVAVDPPDLHGIATHPLDLGRRDLDRLVAAVLPGALAIRAHRDGDLMRRPPICIPRPAELAPAQRRHELVIAERLTGLPLELAARLQEQRVGRWRQLEAHDLRRQLRVAPVPRQVTASTAGDRRLDLADRLVRRLGQPDPLGLRRDDPGQLTRRREAEPPVVERRPRRRQRLERLGGAQPLAGGLRPVAEHALHVLQERAEPEVRVDPLPPRDHQPAGLLEIQRRPPRRQPP